MNKFLILIIIVIVLAIGWFMFFGQSQISQDNQTQTENNEEVKEEMMAAEDIKGNSATLMATLNAVDGSDSSGKAYLLRDNGKLMHVVEASMPDPAEGSVYEGWLVQKDPLSFFSTGVMEKNSEGMWVLEFNSDNDYPTYNKVVITEETVVDETPEEHIIDGEFQL